MSEIKKKSLAFVQPKRLLIADMFKGQLTNKVKILIEKYVKIVPVPHNMTNYFQPLDLTGNPSCQLFLHDKAQLQYAELVQPQISKGIAPETISVDLKICIVKPIHTKWMTEYYNHIRADEDIENGWHRSGITKAIKQDIHNED